MARTRNRRGATDHARTLEGESIDGSDLTLAADGVRGLSGETTLENWGTVRNGSTLTVGFVADAEIESGAVNGTDSEAGTDVIVVVVEGVDLEEGTVLVSEDEDGEYEDVDPDALRGLALTWNGTFSPAELDEYALDR